MKIKTLFKLAALMALVAWAVPARAGIYYDLRNESSSATLRVGLAGLNPGDSVLTSSGTFTVLSTSTTSGHLMLKAKNASGTVILSLTQGGTLTVATVVGNLTGNVTGNATGNAGTATALAADPTACPGGQAVTDIAANGTLTCTAVGAGDAVLTSTQTWSGGNSLYGSTTFYARVEFKGIHIDSSTQTGALSYPGSGATACNVCLARSTLTVVSRGLPVEVNFNAPASECNSNQQMLTNFLINGAFVSGFSTTVTPGRDQCAGTGIAGNASFSVKLPASLFTSGTTYNFCAIACSSVGNFESGAVLPQFRVREILVTQ